MNTKITYIVVCFNSAKYVLKCLDSILNQTYSNYDILVVDNNSSDDTISIIKNNFQNKVTIISNSENLGYGAAITKAIEQTENEFLAILNADTYLDKNWSKFLIQKFNSDQKIMSLSGKVLFPDEQLQSMGGIMDKYGAVIQRGSKLYYDRKIKNSNTFFYNDGSSLMIRKKIFTEIKFDPKLFLYYEDVDLSWKIKMLSYKIDYVDESISYHHLGHSISDITLDKFYYLARNRLFVCQKNYSLKNNIVRVPIIIVLVFFNAFYYDMQKSPKGYITKFFKAMFWNFINIKYILNEHRLLQNKRKISDKELDQDILKNSIEFLYLFDFKK